MTNFLGLFEPSTFVDDFAEGKYVRQSNNLVLDGFFVQVGLSFDGPAAPSHITRRRSCGWRAGPRRCRP